MPANGGLRQQSGTPYSLHVQEPVLESCTFALIQNINYILMRDAARNKNGNETIPVCGRKAL